MLEIPPPEIGAATVKLTAEVWHRAYPDRRPWAVLEQATRDEWTRLMDIASDVIAQERHQPDMQCSDCGSMGPFRGITYPSTPNGPEEHDVECEACGSLNVAESPHEAFRNAEDRWMKIAADEFKRGLKVAAGICRNAQKADDYTLADILCERIEGEIKVLPA